MEPTMDGSDSFESRNNYEDNTEESYNENQEENGELKLSNQLNDDINPEEADANGKVDFSLIEERAEESTISWSFLEFYHSYAYDCRRYFNLCVASPDTLLFVSGNLINFFNVLSGSFYFKAGQTREGIGHIAKNQVFNHIAIGENSENPTIIIYQWPSMKIVTTLEGGTTRRFSYLNYSPDGLLLASQGGPPDYYITLWNWQESKIALRCKSFVQEVYNITFALSVPGCLTSSGSGHVKFWKIARTFTGQKLKGEIGRFGKTEISDVLAVYPMPDETVVSGCDWGNILLWDGGLIKFEVRKRSGEASHANCITQFEYINGELISIGMDGWIRFWFYETIDHADLPDTERFLEIQPIHEFHIAEDDKRCKESSMLMCIKKRDNEDPKNTLWYGQDGNGGLWLIDLCTIAKPEKPRKIFTCHAGPIVDMDVALWGPYLATLDASGHLHIYNFLRKRLIIAHNFLDNGSQIVWLPCEIDATGCTLITAFASGLIRTSAIDVLRADKANDFKGDYVRLIRVIKPHAMSISIMSLYPEQSILVTASEDSTVFAFKISQAKNYPDIVPIGYVRLPSPASCVTWNSIEGATLLIGCSKGDIAEVVLKTEPPETRVASYELIDCNFATLKFQSVRSAIEREEIRQEQLRAREERLEKRREEMEQLKIANPHITIDEETFLIDFHEDPPLPEIYIPEQPNRVLVVQYTENGTVWVLMGGFDAGYVYEYSRPLSADSNKDPLLKTVRIEDAKNTEIRTSLFYKNRKYLILGTEHGEIRVCKFNPDDQTDFSNYWKLPIHEYYNGHISKMLLGYNRRMLLTSGHDGNIFAFNIKDDTPHEDVDIPKRKRMLQLPSKDVEDIKDKDQPSIEEVVTSAEEVRLLEEAKIKKQKVQIIIYELMEEYKDIVERNQNLVPSQRILELELDPRITSDLEDHLKEEMALTRRKLEFKMEKSSLELKKLMDRFINPLTCIPFGVRCILKPEKIVYSLRESKIEGDFALGDFIAAAPSKSQDDTGRLVDESSYEMPDDESLRDQPDQIENLLKLKFGKISYGLQMQINQMAAKYRERTAVARQRKEEWDALNAKKPNLSKREKEDKALLEETRRTIGEYRLKEAETPELTRINQDTALSKYKELVFIREKLHILREDYNSRLRELRTKKQDLQKEVHRLRETLKRIHREIPENCVKPLPEIPTLDIDIEFPEHNIELLPYVPISERTKRIKEGSPSPIENQKFDPSDIEYEVLLLDEDEEIVKESTSLSALFSSAQRTQLQSSIQSDTLKTLNAKDQIETQLEREMKRERMMRKIYEQDCILRHIQNSYEMLDKELNDLEVYRLQVISESVYIQLFMLTLYEELIILRESESTENSLLLKVDGKTMEYVTLQQKMRVTNLKIATKEEEIKRLQLKIKDLATRFTVAVSDNKFHDFLQKVYRKKFTVKKEGSDETSSASSESSSEDLGNEDDSDMERMIFDENICPAGCDKELYKMAFSMRDTRYGYEHQIKEEQKTIELLRKEVEIDAKSLRIAENQLKEKEAELEAFRMEKQRKLNDIDVTVVLKFHQMQHILNAEEVPRLKDCLVFDRDKLSSLYARVGELQQETQKLHEKLKDNRSHIHRVKLDCRHMEEQNKKLEEEITEESIRKFGRKISLTYLYEMVLRRLIYNARTDFRSITMDFDEQIKSIKRECEEGLISLESLLKENTEKLSILTVLEQEKAKLEKILKRTSISEEEMLQIEEQHKKDLVKLETILESQKEQKRLLQNDIRSLRLKTQTVPSISAAGTCL